VSNESGIVSSGRNRVYDPSGGIDPLQRTPLAHAEMNAIAAVRDAVELASCEIWSTQSPCSMCHAAITFAEIPAVHYLASDPSDPGRPGPYISSGLSDDIWTVVANAFFLHNVAWVVGSDNPMLAENRRAEPEVVSLALDLLDRQTLIEPARMGLGVEVALAGAWDQVVPAALARRTRISKSG